MGMNNAQRQRAYRQRHLNDTDGKLDRLNTMITIPAKCRLLRLAKHYGITQREVLERALDEMEDRALRRMASQQQEDYYG